MCILVENVWLSDKESEKLFRKFYSDITRLNHVYDKYCSEPFFFEINDAPENIFDDYLPAEIQKGIKIQNKIDDNEQLLNDATNELKIIFSNDDDSFAENESNSISEQFQDQLLPQTEIDAKAIKLKFYFYENELLLKKVKSTIEQIDKQTICSQEIYKVFNARKLSFNAYEKIAMTIFDATKAICTLPQQKNHLNSQLVQLSENIDKLLAERDDLLSKLHLMRLNLSDQLLEFMNENSKIDINIDDGNGLMQNIEENLNKQENYGRVHTYWKVDNLCYVNKLTILDQSTNTIENGIEIYIKFNKILVELLNQLKQIAVINLNQI